MTGNNLDILCDLLNSNFIAYVFKRFYSGGGLGEDGYRYKKQFIKKLPLPKQFSIGDSETDLFKFYKFSIEEIEFILSLYNQ